MQDAIRELQEAYHALSRLVGALQTVSDPELESDAIHAMERLLDLSRKILDRLATQTI